MINDWYLSYNIQQKKRPIIAIIGVQIQREKESNNYQEFDLKLQKLKNMTLTIVALESLQYERSANSQKKEEGNHS